MEPAAIATTTSPMPSKNCRVDRKAGRSGEWAVKTEAETQKTIICRSRATIVQLASIVLIDRALRETGGAKGRRPQVL